MPVFPCAPAVAPSRGSVWWNSVSAGPAAQQQLPRGPCPALFQCCALCGAGSSARGGSARLRPRCRSGQRAPRHARVCSALGWLLCPSCSSSLVAEMCTNGNFGKGGCRGGFVMTALWNLAWLLQPADRKGWVYQHSTVNLTLFLTFSFILGCSHHKIFHFTLASFDVQSCTS